MAESRNFKELLLLSNDSLVDQAGKNYNDERTA
jgi:hypothetical protein